MYSYPVIEGQTILVLLLGFLFLAIFSYQWIAWSSKRRILRALSKPRMPFNNDIWDHITLSLFTVKASVKDVTLDNDGFPLPDSTAVRSADSASQSSGQSHGVLRRTEETEEKVFSASESLAVIIGFLAVVALCLSVAGFLLGEP